MTNAVAIATALLPFLTPDGVMSNGIAPGMIMVGVVPIPVNVQASWSQPTNLQANSIMELFYGIPGNIHHKWILPTQTNCVFSNWDARLPLSLAVVDSYLGDGIWFWKIDGFADQSLFMDTNALPFGYSANGTFYLIGWGNAGMNYTVMAGTNPTGMTNQVFQTAGTNGIWIYSEAVQPGARFFKTQAQR